MIQPHFVNDMTDPRYSDTDRALAFAIPHRSARGRVVRLGPTLDTVLAAHAYPPAIEALLAEALTLAALIGSTLKDASGQLTMQTRTDNGVVQLLVCDYRGGAVRGYVQYDADKLAEAPEQPTLFALFGAGYLAITFDLETTSERYQGIVPLDGETLTEAAQNYFVQSEQIPTLIRVGIDKRSDGTTIAGGLFLQHLPEGEDGRERLHTRLDHPEWEHVATLGTTMGAAELTDPALPLEALVWRLFNEEEVRVHQVVPDRARVPLYPGAYPQRDREVPAGGAAGDGGRRRRHPGGLRVLRECVPGAGRGGCLNSPSPA